MARLTMCAVAAIAVAVAFGGARRLIRAKAPRLMDRVMEDVMPRMMDACFARMPPERRAFMLTHCRGQLDRVEALYVPTEEMERAEVA